MAKSSVFSSNTKIPDHIVIIPDGNRRWARARGVSALLGHKAGLETMIKTLKAARRWGVHTVTVWGLSTENWIERPKTEVAFLMRIISKTIDEYINEAMKDGVRVVHLGRKDRLPQTLINKIEKVEAKTRGNKKYVLNIALDYGGQDELVRAIKRIVEDKIDVSKIDEKLVDGYLDTANQPYPYADLVVRTSGEQRTSGVLLWQSHYAETYWERDHFPDFGPKKLKEAILDYSRRRRRYGGNDAVRHLTFKPEVTAKLELEWWRLSKVPKGTRFRDFAIKYLIEQYGLSLKLAKEAARHFLEASVNQDKKEWKKAKISLKKFYRIIKDHLKLAFEPEIVTLLRVKLWKEISDKKDAKKTFQAEEIAKNLYAEQYRISHFQAAKAAHLRILAEIEKNLALQGGGEKHWKKAEDYLSKFYKALKERVA